MGKKSRHLGRNEFPPEAGVTHARMTGDWVNRGSDVVSRGTEMVGVRRVERHCARYSDRNEARGEQRGVQGGATKAAGEYRARWDQRAETLVCRFPSSGLVFSRFWSFVAGRLAAGCSGMRRLGRRQHEQ